MRISILLLSFLLSAASLVFAQSETIYPEGLKVGDIAPAFAAKDQDGRLISLKEALRRGPVVLLFYRGQWCPFCNKQLSHY